MGTGLPIWEQEDVESYVAALVSETESWAGVRLATEGTDDCVIHNDCAQRPLARAGPESLTRQCEYVKAATILGRAVEAARVPIEDRAVVGELIPGLLSEYLTYVGMAEFAPVDVGGPNKPYTKMMALFRVIYDAHLEVADDEELPGRDLVRRLRTLQGEVAKASQCQKLAQVGFGDRGFRALEDQTGSRDECELSLVAAVKTVGTWPDCLSELKKSALTKAETVSSEPPALPRAGPMAVASRAGGPF